MTWTDVLLATGMLTRDQSDLVDPEAWDQALHSGHWIIYRDAVWDPHQFQRGAHRAHRILVSSLYLALRDGVTSWTREITRGEVCADARLRLNGSPWQYWLEADTGKETHRQWLTKLDRYRNTFWDSEDLLLVVAAGRSTRLQRLEAWIQEADLPLCWILLSAEAFDPNYAQWSLHTTHSPAPPAIRPPHVAYCVEDHGPIPAHEVLQWIHQGYRVGYTKIVAGGELRVLVRSRSQFLKHLHRSPI